MTCTRRGFRFFTSRLYNYLRQDQRHQSDVSESY
jgi:hypothetical protein